MSGSWLYKRWEMLSWGNQIQELSERGWRPVRLEFSW